MFLFAALGLNISLSVRITLYLWNIIMTGFNNVSCYCWEAVFMVNLHFVFPALKTQSTRQYHTVLTGTRFLQQSLSVFVLYLWRRRRGQVEPQVKSYKMYLVQLDSNTVWSCFQSAWIHGGKSNANVFIGSRQQTEAYSYLKMNV